jgi:hypothetical protein
MSAKLVMLFRLPGSPVEKAIVNSVSKKEPSSAVIRVSSE